MEKHIRHDPAFRNVGEFQGKVNDAGQIPNGGRDLASVRATGHRVQLCMRAGPQALPYPRRGHSGWAQESGRD